MNLQHVEGALLQFCTTSRDNLNWEKTTVFWVSKELQPYWAPHPTFQWTQRGVTVRYLGVQVGIDLAPELHVAPLLLTLKKKFGQQSDSCQSCVVIVYSVVYSFLLDLFKIVHWTNSKFGSEFYMGGGGQESCKSEGGMLYVDNLEETWWSDQCMALL